MTIRAVPVKRTLGLVIFASMLLTACANMPGDGRPKGSDELSINAPPMPLSLQAASILYRCEASRQFKKTWSSMAPSQQDVLADTAAKRTVKAIRTFFFSSTNRGVKKLEQAGFGRWDELRSVLSGPVESMSVTRHDADTAIHYLDVARLRCHQSNAFFQWARPVVAGLEKAEKQNPRASRLRMYDNLRNDVPQTYGAWMVIWHERNNLLSVGEGCAECRSTGIENKVRNDMQRRMPQ